jgi:hypothetical protein
MVTLLSEVSPWSVRSHDLYVPGLRAQRRSCSGRGLPLLPIRATVIPHSEPGSVRTMCSLAASGFRMEGGETHDGSFSPALRRERGAA